MSSSHQDLGHLEDNKTSVSGRIDFGSPKHWHKVPYLRSTPSLEVPEG